MHLTFYEYESLVGEARYKVTKRKDKNGNREEVVYDGNAKVALNAVMRKEGYTHSDVFGMEVVDINIYLGDGNSLTFTTLEPYNYADYV